MSLLVRPVTSRKDLLKFIRFPWHIYQNDPAWIPPLIQERKDVLNPKKNPYFEHAEAALFLAERDGETVGRISAQIDRLHLERHKDDTGFFGFFESVNEREVAEALLARATSWLKEHGMKKIRGPFNFSINEESGLLIDGFDTSPVLLMTHNPPYYATLLESCELRKIKDLYAWHYDATKPIPAAPKQIADEVLKYPGLVVRPIRMNHLEEDIRIVMEVFNEAWENNWGFVPLTESEIKKAVKDFRLILDPTVALIAEVDGKPAAICLAVPNINEAIRDLNGKLFPTGLIKLLYRIKRRKISSLRLMLMGVKKEYRGSVLGGLSVLLYVMIHEAGKTRGYRWGELSWTLEDNEKINAGIEFMGGKRYKIYRIYEKPL